MSKPHVKMFGIRIDNVTMEEAFKRFVGFLKKETTSAIFTPNPEMVLEAQRNLAFKEALLEAEMVVADGIGIIYASKIHHLGLAEKVGGVDLMERMLKFLNTTKGTIYLLGAKPEVAGVAAFKIVESFPNIKVLGYHDGYFDAEEELKIVDSINELKPDVIFVGLGSPRQELWIHKYKRIINCKVAIGIGGGIDIWAGHAKRAPKWIQHMGMEWFYRLLREPRRIKRMLKLPIFVYKVVTMRKI